MKKIVQGQFDLFQLKYKPFLEEYEAKDFLRLTSSGSHQKNISQVCLDPRALKSKLIQYVQSLCSILERPQLSSQWTLAQMVKDLNILTSSSVNESNMYVALN